MKLQSFVVLATLAACGTNPGSDVADAGSDISDASPDAPADAREDADATADTEPDLIFDGQEDGGRDATADAVEDAVPDAIEDAVPDLAEDIGTGGPIEARGWYSTSFEHAGFIRDGEVDPASFGPGCNPYFAPLEGREQWWTIAPLDTGLAIHPSPHDTGWTRVGLIDAVGTVSEADPTGHMGAYDRDFTLETSMVDACATARSMPHCMTPRTADMCFEGLEFWGESRRHELVEIMAGPIGTTETFELHIFLGEDVADGRTDVILHFDVTRSDFEPEDARFVHGAADLRVRHGMIELHGFAFVEVPVEVDPNEGWIVVDRSDGSVEVSLALLREDGTTTRVWGDFAITDTLALP